MLALAASTAPVVAAALDGWWDMPPGDFTEVLCPVDAALGDVPSRVLWVGDPEVLPGGDAWPLAGGLAYTTSGSATPDLGDLWPATGVGASERLGEAVTLAAERQTARVGHILASMAVQYVAVPTALAPETLGDEPPPAGDDATPTVSPSTAVGDLVAALDSQLDLEQVQVDGALALYRNVAFAPLRATGISAEARAETTLTGLQHLDFSGAMAVLPDADGADAGFAGELDAGDTVVHASSASRRWALEVDARAVGRTDAYGWAEAFEAAEGGEARLHYRTPLSHYALLTVQVVLWLAALLVALRMRFGPAAPALRPGQEGSAAAPEPDPAAPGEPAEQGGADGREGQSGPGDDGDDGDGSGDLEPAEPGVEVESGERVPSGAPP
jgi:hypothetical protein